MAAGKVWLVGAGPGDIGLFTLKGAAVLHQADVVVYDSLVGEGVLAKIPEHARLINVGKRANHHTMVQEDINKVLLEEAEKGKARCGSRVHIEARNIRLHSRKKSRRSAQGRHDNGARLCVYRAD